MEVTAQALVFFTLFLGALGKLPLPPYITPCSIKDSKLFGECARERANEVIPKLINGNEIYGVPTLDPLLIERFEVNNVLGAMGFKLVATNVEVYGIRNVVVDNVTHSFAPQEDVFGVSIPDVYINCTYNISGHILMFPMVGYGNAVIILKNVSAIYNSSWELKTLDDDEIYYLPASEANLNIETDYMHVFFDNLFNGEVTLAGMTLNFINLNWREVFGIMRPSFTKTFSKIISDILRGIFSQVPFEDAFLDAEDIEME